MMYLIAFLLFIIALPILVPLVIIVGKVAVVAFSLVVIIYPPIYTVLALISGDTGGAFGSIFLVITFLEVFFLLCQLTWVDWSRFNR
jgi:hypothetical protein